MEKNEITVTCDRCNQVVKRKLNMQDWFNEKSYINHDGQIICGECIDNGRIFVDPSSPDEVIFKKLETLENMIVSVCKMQATTFQSLIDWKNELQQQSTKPKVVEQHYYRH